MALLSCFLAAISALGWYQQEGGGFATAVVLAGVRKQPSYRGRSIERDGSALSRLEEELTDASAKTSLAKAQRSHVARERNVMARKVLFFVCACICVYDSVSAPSSFSVPNGLFMCLFDG